MRNLLAGLLDSALCAVVAYAGFLLAQRPANCGAQPGACVALTPWVLLFVCTGLVLYLAVPFAVWRSTLGQHVFAASDRRAP